MAKVLILRTAGTNCDNETAFAFELAGARAEFVHINELIRGKKKMSAYQVMAIPGGFSYGDDIASGKILANELRFKLGKDVERFVKDGKLIIGICNGFQVLVKAGLLPAIYPYHLRGGVSKKTSLHLGGGKGQWIEATLTLNDSAKFQDQWVYLRVKGYGLRVKCVWTQNLPETIYLPIAHGEGKFVPKDKKTLKKLWENGQVVLQYVNNPNGSVDDIAGICDQTGRVFGLMPHPERHVSWEQHPRRLQEPGGLQIFKNAVEYAKNNL